MATTHHAADKLAISSFEKVVSQFFSSQADAIR